MGVTWGYIKVTLGLHRLTQLLHWGNIGVTLGIHYGFIVVRLEFHRGYIGGSMGVTYRLHWCYIWVTLVVT